MASSSTNEKAARLDKLEEAMDILASKIDHQFQISSQVAAIDLETLADMNTSATTFYAGMNERITELVDAAAKVQDRASIANRFSASMAALLRRAQNLEAIVDRLDEYTSKQEAALTRVRR